MRRRFYEDYNDSPTFRAFITNLGKYNEGELVGEWVDFPITDEDWNIVLERIGIDGEYEEWFVTDYECNLHGFDWQELGEYPSFEELQEFGELVDSITDVEAVDNAYEYTGDLREAIDGLENGDIQFYPGINTDSDLGYYYVDEAYGGVENLDRDTLERYFDYESLGRDLDMDSYGEDDEMNAGEYFCGDEGASHTEIGEAYVEDVGFDGVQDPDMYFDYEQFGRDMAFDGMFTKDGFIFAA